MTGNVNEQRERRIIEQFALGRQPAIEVLEYEPSGEQGPDFLVRDLVTGQHAGVECTEVLDKSDGRDRFLESAVVTGIKQACSELLGRSGEVRACMSHRPEDLAQVKRWLGAFRKWLEKEAARIRSSNGIHYGVFPEENFEDAHVNVLRELGGTPEELMNAEQELTARKDLEWLTVDSVVVFADETGWMVEAYPGTQHFADRHGHDIEEEVVDAARRKVAKAAAYKFDHQLWLVLRSPWMAEPSAGIDALIANLPGIETFTAVYLLDVPANVLDAARPPRVRALYRRGRR